MYLHERPAWQIDWTHQQPVKSSKMTDIETEADIEIDIPCCDLIEATNLWIYNARVIPCSRGMLIATEADL